MQKLKSFTRQRPTGGLLGSELEELARAATKKTLPAPDEGLIQQVVDAINSSASDASNPTRIVEMLKGRLTQSNPHKVWLATALTGKILEECPTAVAGVREEIFQLLAAVAAKPLDRYQDNFKSEQRAKMNAFAILRASGREAHRVLRRTAGLGKMASLTPPPPPKARSPAACGDVAKASDGSGRPTSPDVLVDATGRTAPSNPGWTVKHVSGKDAAMNAVKDEKRDAREAKLRATRAARAEAKAGRGTVEDTPEEASRARAQAAAAAASSTALAEALLSKTRRGGNGSGSGSGSGRGTPTEEGSGKRLHPSSWTETRDSVNTSVGLADSYTEMILDLVKNLTSGQSAAPDVERHFLDDLVKEMSTFRVAFEQLMGLLATFKSAEASALLDAALKKMDAMNATMALYEDVVDSMPAPSAPSAENSPTAAAAMAKAPSVLAARSRSRELAAGAGANGVAADAANRPTSPLGNPAVPRGAAGAGSSPLDNLMDVNDALKAVAPQPVPSGAFMGNPAAYGYMPGHMYPGGQYPVAQPPMGYMPYPPPQVMYMPVTGPNGEQGFAPVPMQMPQHMPFPHQASNGGGGGGGPVHFVQGPHGYFMPVAAGAAPQPAAAATVPQPAAPPAHAAVQQPGQSKASANPFEPQASAQRRQDPLQVPSFGGGSPATMAAAAPGEQPAAGGSGAAAAQASPQKPAAARPSLQSSPARPSNASSAGSLSRPDSSNSLGGEEGGFRNGSTGSLQGTTVRRIDSTGSSIFGAPSETALESLHLGLWPGGSAAQSPAKGAMFPPSPARPPPAASSYTLRPQEPANGRVEASESQAFAQAAEPSAPAAGAHSQQPAGDIFDEILR